ncbi:RtcB family protein [Candidatus Woesearchaeota archaeon]|nr:RtcB family protein [Candidatus Woesearchaeota archaeon]
MEQNKLPSIKRVDKAEWIIEKDYKQGMKVPAKIFATEKIVKEMDFSVYEQITNVATLPGIINYAMCMPDGHSGYGFPIGGVAAFDTEKGVISPGGIGFDVNCGMRLVLTSLTYKDIQPKLKLLVDNLFERVPAGVGSTGFVKLNASEFREAVENGAEWCVEKGYGWQEDLKKTEEYGCMENADSKKISERSISRGLNQIGTLGSGNHYLEVQVVKEENIFDKEIAKKIGLFPEQVVIMFHCGSRGFGHQVATDYLQIFLKVMESKYGIKILDRELACAPFNSKEGQDYFSAMKCAINMSFANRQTILHRIREVFSKIFQADAEKLGLKMVYDVAHNTAKLEKHIVDGKEKEVLVHRKGATRALGPGRKEVCEGYRSIGQPVIIGGSMETGSYLLLGTKEAEMKTFGSTAHGSGRTMSRAQARRTWRGEKLQKEMESRGIYVRTTSFSGLAEEAGGAYKDIDDVIEAASIAGISKKVCKFKPIGNVKG